MHTRTFWTIAVTCGTGIVVSCTQSYDDFDFSGATTATGTETGTAAGTTTGTASGTGTAGTAGGGATASGTGGAGTGTGSGQGGAGATGGSAGGTGGSGGGGTTDATVLCGTTQCDVSSGGYCCFSTGGATCEASGSGCGQGETDIYCDEPADCPGQVCCGTFQFTRYTIVECVDDCSGGGEFVFCDPNAADPCPSGGTCQESGILSDFYNCR